MKKIIVLILIFSFSSTWIVVDAHPGRTDKKGGHTCRTNCSKRGLKNGQYHLHKKK